MNLTNVLFDAILGVIQKLLMLLLTQCFDFFMTSTPGANTITDFPFYNGILSLMKIISASLIALITVFEATKSHFVELGMKGQEPIKILGKCILGIFLINYINEIFLWGIDVTNQTILAIGELQGKETVKKDDFLNAFIDTGTKGVTNFLINIFIIVLIFYMVKLIIKMYVRIVMMSMIVIFSPIACSCIPSESLGGFFDGLKKLYIGNLIIQILQVTGIVITKTLMANAVSGNAGEKFYNIAIIIATLSIIDRLEEIVRDLSISVGLNRDMGGGLQKLGSTVHSINMIKSVFVK